MDTYIKNYTNTFDIKGKEITVTAPARFEKNTDRLINDNELDDQAAEIAQEIYRQKYGFVGPADIKKLRKKWKLSQRQLASVLGWSPSTIALYEVGEIPTVGNNRLLNVLIKNPQVMKDFIEEKKNSDNLEL